VGQNIGWHFQLIDILCEQHKEDLVGDEQLPVVAYLIFLLTVHIASGQFSACLILKRTQLIACVVAIQLLEHYNSPIVLFDHILVWCTRRKPCQCYNLMPIATRVALNSYHQGSLFVDANRSLSCGLDLFLAQVESCIDFVAMQQ
jgi:hypothetical protein